MPNPVWARYARFLRKENTMHTVDQLRGELPELTPFIKRSRGLAKAAVIATSPSSDRSLVVTTACRAGEDYHLVNLYGCPPTELRWGLPDGKELMELRPEKWNRLINVIRAFLAGKDEYVLVELAAGRSPF